MQPPLWTRTEVLVRGLRPAQFTDSPGRDGLFEVIKSRPPEFAYEPELLMAENDLVMLWGRFTGHGAGPLWIS
jgi:hypothetical protein